MQNESDIQPPADASHFQLFYGSPQYFRKTTRVHLNQVSEEWQSFAIWHEWDFRKRIWVHVGEGFSERRLKEITHMTTEA